MVVGKSEQQSTVLLRIAVRMRRNQQWLPVQHTVIHHELFCIQSKKDEYHFQQECLWKVFESILILRRELLQILFSAKDVQDHVLQRFLLI